jgi:hypothetical protein
VTDVPVGEHGWDCRGDSAVANLASVAAEATHSVVSSSYHTIATGRHGEVPVGEHQWELWQANWVEGSETEQFLEKPLTVTELTSGAEVAEAKRVVLRAVELWRRRAVGLGPEATDAEIAAARERRDGMVNELFERYDADKDGFLDSASYREYLVGIKFWGTGVCTDSKYEAEGWAVQCKNLDDSDPAVGISLAGFRALYAKYRTAQLEEDYASARGGMTMAELRQ